VPEAGHSPGGKSMARRWPDGESEPGRSRSTLDALTDAVIRTDAEGRVEYLNPAAIELLGRSVATPGEGLDAALTFCSGADRIALPDLLRGALASGEAIETALDAELERPDGTRVPVRGSIRPLAERNGAVIAMRDVTALRVLERELDYLARHDSLTGLLNRRELEAELARALASAATERRLHALLYLDLDELKLVNDTCGHLAGDDLLRQVATTLASCLRESDRLARLGGDEFGLVLFDCDAVAAREVAEELRRVLRSSRFAWQDQAFEIGASIGLVLLTAASGDAAEALRGADSACYVVKAAGGNGVHMFSPDDTAIGLRHGEMLWVHRLRRALRDGRLRLYYQLIQPVAASQPLRLCEVFVRMLDPDGTLHSAARFIAAAERYHMIDEVDRWVIETALAVVAKAHRDCTAAGELVPVFALNVSARSLASRGFLELVLAEIASSGAPPQNICFEITETAAISNLKQARAFISAVRLLGCRVALDDFGRGLSSFGYLRDLHVDLLKIDGDFVHGLEQDPVNRALVAAIHQVGRAMGLVTIAEGVESREALDVLREIGLDYAQGRYCDPPKPLLHDIAGPRAHGPATPALRTGGSLSR
jgi:diguanylate cyclase (GGDEF)-like protein/PAS domain S-box-containing protein